MHVEENQLSLEISTLENESPGISDSQFLASLWTGSLVEDGAKRKTGKNSEVGHFTRCQFPLGPSNRSLFTG